MALFQEALRFYQAGDLARAEEIARRAFAVAPDQPDILRLLGAILSQRGRTQEAVPLLEKSALIAPQVPETFYILGNVLQTLKRTDQAIQAYENALKLHPKHIGTRNNLGHALAEMGCAEEALPHFEAGLALDPKQANILNNYGLALQKLKRTDEAIGLFRRALEIKPDFPYAINNLGLSLKEKGELDEAAVQFERVLALAPNYAAAWSNLGNVLREKKLFAEAIEKFRRALELDPNYAEAYSNLGNALADDGQTEESIANYERCIALRPDDPNAHYNLATLYHAQRNIGKAFEHYKNALAAKPDHAETHWNVSILLLLCGDYLRGWREYEWRWRIRDSVRHRHTSPLWDGGDLTGKTILLHAEQGLGDSLQFIRYVPLVKAKGAARIIVECHEPLLSLFRQFKEIDALIHVKEPTPPHDCRAPFMSLPLLCGTTSLEAIPSKTPYLFAPPDKAAAWKAKTDSAQGTLKVGLLWAGNPRKDMPNAYEVDKRRSMRLEQFAPLAEIKNVHFFSLQKGEETAAQAASPPQGMILTDLMGEVEDFTDTAALIANLDLVIGVDTSVIHLAGAMNKPVWVLSRFDGCWRWLLDRTDSPWYPTLRIFRQKEPGNWDAVVEEVKRALKTLVMPAPAFARTGSGGHPESSRAIFGFCGPRFPPSRE